MKDEKKEVAVSQSKGKDTSDVQKYSSPLEDMERMFDDFMHRRFFAPSWMPRFQFPDFKEVSTSIDMYEEGDELIIKAEMPGIKKEEISIDFTEDMITISGEKKSEEKTERKDFHRVERSFGSFTRKVRLPVEIQVEKAHASYKEGVLEIRMPKSEKEKQKVRKIAVK